MPSADARFAINATGSRAAYDIAGVLASDESKVRMRQVIRGCFGAYGCPGEMLPWRYGWAGGTPRVCRDCVSRTWRTVYDRDKGTGEIPTNLRRQYG